MSEKQAKQRIIKATIDILHEEKSIEKISIRRIAKKAKVGIGLINYHFQTKENLIGEAIRYFISSIISQWDDVVKRDQTTSPESHLIKMLQATAQFIVSFPCISRISILNDLNSPRLDDNTMETLYGMLPVAGELNTEIKPENLRFIAMECLARIQWFFIRHESVKNLTDFDFFDDDIRNQYIKKLVAQLCDEVRSMAL